MSNRNTIQPIVYHDGTLVGKGTIASLLSVKVPATGATKFQEIVSGSVTSWTLSNTPIGEILLVANGQIQLDGTDFTISGKNITTISSWSAGQLQASYSY